MRKPTEPPTTGAAGSARKPRSAADVREERLKAALKANMARRKAQAKARTADDAGPGDTGKSG
ncbi:MAG: hypothetical protein U1E06_00275 [Tabrizicola sp.]|uniref:hypothetical protein n=1 Tax=Tabrizicola sp. TaxID=2005166 RepID=UPI002AB8910D|nr:hypothetical protein [Tabrizicola sp.]